MLALKIQLSALLEQLNKNNVMLILNLLYNPLVATSSSSQFNNVTSDVNYLLESVFFKPSKGATMEVVLETQLANKTIEQSQIKVLVRGFRDPDLCDNLLEYNLYLVARRESAKKRFGFEETNASVEELASMNDFILSLNLQQNTYAVVKIN